MWLGLTAPWQLGWGFVLDPTALKTASGIGAARYWQFKVSVAACGKKFDANVGFSPDWSKPYGLLGQLDFFKEFLVGFDKGPRPVLLPSPRGYVTLNSSRASLGFTLATRSA